MDRTLPTTAAPVAVPAVLPPHPVIAGTYQAPEKKRQYLDAIFDETAGDYDRLEHWLSLGSGRWYRRESLRRAGLQPGMRMVDVAVGTGLLAGEALKLIGPTGSLIGVDPSREMMRRATERLGIETVVGVAESLPFPDSSFDFLSMGYALRHVGDLHAAFREFHRVLKPAGKAEDTSREASTGGRLCILEISRPRTRLGRGLLWLYLGVVSRLMGLVFRLAPRTPELWGYYWQTIDQCVPAETVLDALRTAGFVNVQRKLVGGIFSEYTATRA